MLVIASMWFAWNSAKMVNACILWVGKTKLLSNGSASEQRGSSSQLFSRSPLLCPMFDLKLFKWKYRVCKPVIHFARIHTSTFLHKTNDLTKFLRKISKLIISPTALLSSIFLGSIYIKSAICLSNAATCLTNSRLRLLLLVSRKFPGRLWLILSSGLVLDGRLLGLRGNSSILNSHGSFVDLSEVVIFDGFSSSRGFLSK